MSSEVTIANCPFCGGLAKLVEPHGASFVRCTQCGGQGALCWVHDAKMRPAYNSEAIRLWNMRGNFGQARFAHVNAALPIETFKLLERLKESEDRLERGDFGAVDRGVLLLMREKTLITVMLRMEEAELQGVARALSDAMDVKMEVLR